jgi:hypothetical protein
MKDKFDLLATEREGPLIAAPTKTLSEHSLCLCHRYSTATEECQDYGPGEAGGVARSVPALQQSLHSGRCRRLVNHVRAAARVRPPIVMGKVATTLLDQWCIDH